MNNIKNALSLKNYKPMQEKNLMINMKMTKNIKYKIF